MSQKATFTSKLGVIAATVGSAVGLGTVWRFPNEVQSNGGSVFLITYLLCVLLVGIPVMLAEFSVGRGSGSDAIGAYRKLTPRRPWWIVGVISVLAPYLIMMYYMVVAGWTLQYLWMSLSGALFDGVGSGAAEPEAFQAIMRHSLAEGWQPVFCCQSIGVDARCAEGNRADGQHADAFAVCHSARVLRCVAQFTGCDRRCGVFPASRLVEA